MPERSARHASHRPLYLLPGWQNSGPTHWQSHWERLLPATRVEQADWEHPLRGDWMARLEEVLLADEALLGRPAILIAHSLGCQLVAAWAAHSRHTARVAGALLVAPPDTERADMPAVLAGWRPVPATPLPFRAMVVASSDDPYCEVERARRFARQWGAQFEPVGRQGHLNSHSGLGEWPQGRALLDRLVSAVEAA